MNSTNPVLRHTVVMLERAGKKGVPLWRTASEALAAPGSTSVEVSIGRISRVAAAGASVFVAGKVLGNGRIDKKVTVGAFRFSESAKNKIEAAGGTTMTVEQFLKKHADGRGVKLVK